MKNTANNFENFGVTVTVTDMGLNEYVDTANYYVPKNEVHVTNSKLQV